MRYKIVTDVTNNLSALELEELGIIAIPGFLSLDGEDIQVKDEDEFYRRLNPSDYAPGHIKTAAANSAIAKLYFERAINETDEDTAVVYAGTSPDISSTTVSSHCMAVEECHLDHPNRQLIYAPTYCTSNGQALCLQYLAKYTGDDIISYAEHIGKHIVHLFTQREFKYSLCSGRYEGEGVHRAANFLEAVKFSPWMYFPSNDELKFQKKIIRGDVILHKWAKYYAEQRIRSDEAEDELDLVLRIGYASDVELPRIEKLLNLIKQQVPDFDQVTIQLHHIVPFVGAHTGPTCISIFFRQHDLR